MVNIIINYVIISTIIQNEIMNPSLIIPGCFGQVGLFMHETRNGCCSLNIARPRHEDAFTVIVHISICC